MIHLYITFDVDPDYSENVRSRNEITWHGLENIPNIQQALASRKMPFTFFVRVDNQIADFYGDFLGIYNKYQYLWEKLIADGNEFGWHPHLYAKNEGGYIPERTPEVCRDILARAWESVLTLPFKVSSCRIGEAWHSNLTMQTLDKFGLKIDSTAVPGRKRDDAARQFDWEITTNTPYFPSIKDYRVPDIQDSLDIFEVPMTTVPILTCYDSVPVNRYLNPTFKPDLFSPAFEKYVTNLDHQHDHHIVIIFHPDETLGRPANDLHKYGLETCVENIDSIQSSLENSGITYKFCTLSELCT